METDGMRESLAYACQPSADTHQARKAAATRQKILIATINIIVEAGFSGASSAAICARAGVTWGAVQHHFGTKDEIFVAVLELARDSYFRRLDQAARIAGSLEQRVEGYINLLWQHYSSDLYVAFSEILMASRASGINIQREKFHINRELSPQLIKIRALFTDSTIAIETLDEIFRYIHRCLSGMALDRLLEPDVPYQEIHLCRLKRELLAIANH